MFCVCGRKLTMTAHSSEENKHDTLAHTCIHPLSGCPTSEPPTSYYYHQKSKETVNFKPSRVKYLLKLESKPSISTAEYSSVVSSSLLGISFNIKRYYYFSQLCGAWACVFDYHLRSEGWVASSLSRYHVSWFNHCSDSNIFQEIFCCISTVFQRYVPSHLTARRAKLNWISRTAQFPWTTQR